MKSIKTKLIVASFNTSKLKINAMNFEMGSKSKPKVKMKCFMQMITLTIILLLCSSCNLRLSKKQCEFITINELRIYLAFNEKDECRSQREDRFINGHHCMKHIATQTNKREHQVKWCVLILLQRISHTQIVTIPLLKSFLHELTFV